MNDKTCTRQIQPLLDEATTEAESAPRRRFTSGVRAGVKVGSIGPGGGCVGYFRWRFTLG